MVDPSIAGPVLVLAPHADDESLGCGILLASIWAAGGHAHILCLTDGAASHPGSASHPPDRIAALRRAEMLAAIAALGGAARDVTFLGHPDAALHHVQAAELDAGVAARIDRHRAATLLAPSPLDPHCDHEAAAACARRVAAARPGLRLLFYPVWSRWIAGGRAPSPAGCRLRALDRPRHLPAKRAAIAAHASQAGHVVTDAPRAFAMPDGFAAMFGAGPEPYFEAVP